MNELQVFEFKKKLVMDSREVSEAIKQSHNDLMKRIHKYCDHLTEGKIPLSEFFIKSTYSDSTGRTLPCYLITKKGCDMVANKMTGKKGVLFTAAYITRFYEMEQELQKRKALRAEGKTTRRSLTGALKDSGEDNRLHGHGYAVYTNLIYKSLLGKNAAQLRKERGADRQAVAKDFLISDELPSYEKKEAAVAVLLDAGLRYEQIKPIVLKRGITMNFNIPKPIINDFERLNALIEENPIYIPITRVADYLGMNPESLRCAIDQGRATFGFSWKSDIRGNRAFKVPTIVFYNWVMQGHAMQFVHEYTEGKN